MQNLDNKLIIEIKEHLFKTFRVKETYLLFEAISETLKDIL